MKYIDTRDYNSLKHGVMNFLDYTDDDMEHLFEEIDSTDDDHEQWIRTFLENEIITDDLDYIQLFHLSRRLDGSNLHATVNLKQLLLEESPISDFLKKYDVTFKKKDRHIDLYYRGALQTVEGDFYTGPGNMRYILWRLGHYEEQDYCVNGFAYRFHLEKNDYYRNLQECPELVDIIARTLEIENMVQDYYNNSKYYCIEYMIPLSEIIYDGYDSLCNRHDKNLIFISKATDRLYREWKHINSCVDENLILRLADDMNVKKDWFVSAEEL